MNAATGSIDGDTTGIGVAVVLHPGIDEGTCDVEAPNGDAGLAGTIIAAVAAVSATPAPAFTMGGATRTAWLNLKPAARAPAGTHACAVSLTALSQRCSLGTRGLR